MLPKMRYNDGLVKRTQVRFGGYNHTKSCSEGGIYDMKNMSSDNYPLLSPRPLRRELATLLNPTGIGAKDALFYADDGKFYYDGKEIKGLTLDAGEYILQTSQPSDWTTKFTGYYTLSGTTYSKVTGSSAPVWKEKTYYTKNINIPRQFAVINKYVVIFPDKKYYNTNAEKSVISVKSNVGYSKTGDLPGTNLTDGDSYFLKGNIYYETEVYNIYTYRNGWALNNDFKDNDICIGGSGQSGIEEQKTLYYFNALAGGWLRADFVCGNLDATRELGSNCEFEVSRIIAASDKQLEFYFKVGDALRITSNAYAKNNTVAVVTAVTGTSISFDATFSTAQNQIVKLSRIVPDLDFICENDNRLWGCKGDMIYASKLGDPKNFEFFSGLSTDSYAVEAGSSEDFTGCISYQGYPTFFKENYIYKMFGSKPANYQLMCVAALGVATGSSKSIAAAGGILFYHSPSGIVAYTGSAPQIIQHEFGETFSNAVAGGTSTKYYVSMTNGSEYKLFVYDTEKRVWMKEDDLEALGFAFLENDLYCLCADEVLDEDENLIERKIIKVLDKPKIEGGTAEVTISSVVEFGDFYGNSPDKKGVTRYQLRLEVGVGASVSVSVSYDSGNYSPLAEIQSGRKRAVTIPVIPRRCDHFRLKLEGEGAYTIYAITREEYGGSEI